jgi:phosphomannomutase
MDGRPFSKIIDGFSRYFFSGELNFTVPNGPEIVRKVQADYPDGKLTDLDGIRIDFPTWWFNLRVSNTEPLLRLVAEASTPAELAQRKQELIGKIRLYGGAVASG